jgi:hypothetical protein
MEGGVRRFLPAVILVCLGASPPGPDWKEHKVPGYIIHFTDENAGELQAVTGLLKSFQESFCKATGADPALFAGNRLDLYLYPKGSQEVGLGYVSMMGGPQEAGGKVSYVGTIKMPGPAAYDGKTGSSSGHPMDRRFFDKLLIHEAAPAYLELLARRAGARFNGDFPTWFEQGLEEYLGVFHTTSYWRTEGIACYFARLKRDRSSIDADFGLNLRDPYNDGFVALAFIREEFGEPAVFRILTSKEATFGRKMKQAVGVSFEEFVRRFDAWLRKRL